jgi:hypothetical protein
MVILNEVKDLPATATREMLHFVQHDRDGQTGMLSEMKHPMPLTPLDKPGAPGYSFPSDCRQSTILSDWVILAVLSTV